MLGNHLFGLYEKALPPELSLAEKLAFTAELGFDYMEISIDESDERLSRLYWSQQEKSAFHAILSRSSVGLQSMCLSAHRRYPFGSADPAKRAEAGRIMERAVDFARCFGIRVIQLAGYDVYYEPSSEESRRGFLAGLRSACKTAEQTQVMLAMETMDTPFLNSITKYMDYSRILASPWFRVYPDLGNLSAWPENDVCAELELGINEIVQVHLKDTLPQRDSAPGVFKGVPFGSGCVDFIRLFSRLEALGYRGPYTLEMWSSGDPSMEELSRAKRFIAGQFLAAIQGKPDNPDML